MLKNIIKTTIFQSRHNIIKNHGIRRYISSINIDPKKDYYRILDIKNDCNKRDVKLAFVRLSKKWHPDINKQYDSNKRYQEIVESYNILKNDENRKEYDNLREQHKNYSQSKTDYGKTGSSTRYDYTYACNRRPPIYYYDIGGYQVSEDQIRLAFDIATDFYFKYKSYNKGFDQSRGPAQRKGDNFFSGGNTNWANDPNTGKKGTEDVFKTQDYNTLGGQDFAQSQTQNTYGNQNFDYSQDSQGKQSQFTYGDQNFDTKQDFVKSQTQSNFGDQNFDANLNPQTQSGGYSSGNSGNSSDSGSWGNSGSNRSGGSSKGGNNAGAAAGLAGVGGLAAMGGAAKDPEGGRKSNCEYVVFDYYGEYQDQFIDERRPNGSETGKKVDRYEYEEVLQENGLTSKIRRGEWDYLLTYDKNNKVIGARKLDKFIYQQEKDNRGDLTGTAHRSHEVVYEGRFGDKKIYPIEVINEIDNEKKLTGRKLRVIRKKSNSQ